MTSSIAQDASAIDRSDPARSSVRIGGPGEFGRHGLDRSDPPRMESARSEIGHNGEVTSTSLSAPGTVGHQPAERRRRWA